MKNRLSYLVFPLVMLLLIMSILHPENIRGRLGQPISESYRLIHFGVLGIVALGSGYMCVKQGLSDARTHRNKRLGK